MKGLIKILVFTATLCSFNVFAGNGDIMTCPAPSELYSAEYWVNTEQSAGKYQYFFTAINGAYDYIIRFSNISATSDIDADTKANKYKTSFIGPVGNIQQSISNTATIGPLTMTFAAPVKIGECQYAVPEDSKTKVELLIIGF